MLRAEVEEDRHRCARTHCQRAAIGVENSELALHRWLQKGVAEQPAERQMACVAAAELPEVVAGSEYVPPAGFDCEPVRERSLTARSVVGSDKGGGRQIQSLVRDDGMVT